MKKLKTIFSPRKIVVVILIIVGIITVPALDMPAMSQTEAIVTMLCMDKQQDKIVISATVLSPGQDNVANYQVFTGAGDTLGNAVQSVSLAIGKEMGFAQCEVMALGQNLCDEGIMQTLDFMTRTKKVGRNTNLICFEGDINDFSESLSNLNKEKSLSLEKILQFDKRYVLSSEGNIESFYIGYFGDLSLGLMPKVSLKNEEEDNAIEVANSQQSKGSQEETTSSQPKKYFLNDGTITVFKKGKRYMDVLPEDVKKINYFVNANQQGTIELNNVSDNKIYNDATVIVDIVRKHNFTTVSFDGDKPVFKSRIDLVVFVEQVLEADPNKNMLERNNDFLTETVQNKIKQTVKQQMYDSVQFCIDNKVDLLDAYKFFSKLTPTKFENYLKTTTKEDFLANIDFQFDIRVTNEY